MVVGSSKMFSFDHFRVSELIGKTSDNVLLKVFPGLLLSVSWLFDLKKWILFFKYYTNIQNVFLVKASAVAAYSRFTMYLTE